MLLQFCFDELSQFFELEFFFFCELGPKCFELFLCRFFDIEFLDAPETLGFLYELGGEVVYIVVFHGISIHQIDRGVVRDTIEANV